MAALTSRKDELLRKWGRSFEVVVAGAVMFFGVVVRMMSRPVAMRLASLIGDFIHHMVGLRRELVYENLALTFPDKSPEALRRIATGVYRNIAGTFIDVLRFPLIRNLQDVEALVDMDVTPFLRRTEGGQKGAVMLSGHYGNWELMALAFGMKAKPMTIIVKELSNTALDRAINQFRTVHGNSVIYAAQSVRAGLRLLSENGVLAILGDQSDPSSSASGEFLGRNASMFQGAAFFALKANVPLFVGMCRHGDDGRYKVEMQEIDTSGLTPSSDDIALLASRYTKVLEEYIYKWPEEWFWLHNRWKNP